MVARIVSPMPAPLLRGLPETMSATPYVGRFAPSPTGCLHIGSLLTATASYLDARARGGRWLLRMEDLDPPREMPGAAAQILHTLAAFGFEWDGEVAYQSRRHHLYADALATLRAQGRVYPCDCSRREVQQKSPRMGVDGPVYSGRCAARWPSGLPENDGLPENGKTPAWRLRVPPGRLAFVDRVVGVYGQDLAREVGDFVLLRADGFWAYQLAVVVDDAEQGVTHVVRGQDLLVSTPRQLYLQQCLGYATPQYAHLPLLTNRAGQKWSKQSRATPLDVGRAPALLRQVLRWLGLPSPPPDADAAELLAWAVPHWRWETVPKTAMVAESGADARG